MGACVSFLGLVMYNLPQRYTVMLLNIPFGILQIAFIGVAFVGFVFGHSLFPLILVPVGLQ